MVLLLGCNAQYSLELCPNTIVIAQFSKSLPLCSHCREHVNLSVRDSECSNAQNGGFIICKMTVKTNLCAV